MNFLFCGYRDWSLGIVEDLESRFKEDTFFIAKSRKQFAKFAKSNIEFDLVLFVGWSWIIKEKFLKNNNCICIHPSPLPKYRGGSPIQNQIISGEKYSKVTAFLMNDKLDGGPIVSQSYDFSLDGNLSEVFKRVSNSSIFCLSDTIVKKKNGSLEEKEQSNDIATFFKRRSPDQSEIHIDDFSKYTAKEIYDKIRCLQDPYPNAFIVCKDGKKIYLTKAHLDD